MSCIQHIEYSNEKINPAATIIYISYTYNMACNINDAVNLFKLVIHINLFYRIINDINLHKTLKRLVITDINTVLDLSKLDKTSKLNINIIIYIDKQDKLILKNPKNIKIENIIINNRGPLRIINFPIYNKHFSLAYLPYAIIQLSISRCWLITDHL